MNVQCKILVKAPPKYLALTFGKLTGAVHTSVILFSSFLPSFTLRTVREG